MKRLTYRDNEGRAQWAPELLEDNTGMAGSVIRSFVADVEDILGGRSRSESVKRCSISGKAETISDYGKFKIPPPAGTKEKERPSYMDLYQRLTAIEDILGDEYDLDRLRIGSPSKLMRDEIGKRLPRGMAEGIEDETKSANWCRLVERDGAW